MDLLDLNHGIDEPLLIKDEDYCWEKSHETSYKLWFTSKVLKMDDESLLYIYVIHKEWMGS